MAAINVRTPHTEHVQFVRAAVSTSNCVKKFDG